MKGSMDLIALIGESTCGKSTIQKELLSFGYEALVLVTTRPRREGEVSGKDYVYISKEEFASRWEKGEFLSVGEYNGWYYGVAKELCADNCVVVLTPRMLREFKKKFENIVSFYIKVPRRDRLIKALHTRSNIEEIKRRDASDVGQYDGIEDEVDYVIENEGYHRSAAAIAQWIDLVMNGE